MAPRNEDLQRMIENAVERALRVQGGWATPSSAPSTNANQWGGAALSDDDEDAGRGSDTRRANGTKRPDINTRTNRMKDHMQRERERERSAGSIAGAAAAGAGLGGSAGRKANDYFNSFPNAITLESILAGLQPVSMGGGIPMPDKNAFLAPFDRAEQATRDVHGQVVPTIDNIFASVKQGMGEQEQQFTDRMAALSSAAQGQQAAAQAALPAPQQQIAVDPQQVVGSLAAELAANNQGNAQAQASANTADLAMLNEIAAMGQADSATVQQSADAVGAGSRAAADAALQQALNAIGMGRAQAESDYASQAASIGAQNASMQNDAVRLEMEQRQMAMDEWDRINGDILKQATGATWDTDVRRLERRDPTNYQRLIGVLDVAGMDKNEVNYSYAMQEIQAGLTGGTLDESSAATLQDMVRKYYLGGDQVDPTRFRSMGGDPAYLRALGMGV